MMSDVEMVTVCEQWSVQMNVARIPSPFQRHSSFLLFHPDDGAWIGTETLVDSFCSD